MNSENQKTNVENWYTKNGEHYIASFGEEYEQHFSEEKNTDGGCAILTNQHCYLQGKYLLKPKKKSESYSIDEKIPLNKIVKCGIRYSSLTILLICFFLIGWGISLGMFIYGLDCALFYKHEKGIYEYRLADEEPIKKYEKEIDKYNQLKESLINDFTENGMNASCVYLLSGSEEIELSKSNDIKVCIRQQVYNDNAITSVYLVSWFGCEYVISYQPSNADVIFGIRSSSSVSAEHQRHLDEFFSDPESIKKLVDCLETLYADYLNEYFNSKFRNINPSYDGPKIARSFEEIEEAITEYEELLQSFKKAETKYFWLSSLGCFACFALVVIISFLVFKLLKTKFFYIVYRTDTLDDIKLYLLLNKELYREVKSFSSKLEKVKNMKDNSVSTTEQATSKLSENATVNSQPDDLRKYAELLNDGVITQEEFDAMKQKILGL